VKDDGYRMISGLMPFRWPGSVSIFKCKDLHLLPISLVRRKGEVSSGLCDDAFLVITDHDDMRAIEGIVTFVDDNPSYHC
jgi:hypothetical protein